MYPAQVRILTRKRIRKRTKFSESIKYLSKDQLNKFITGIDNIRDKVIIKLLYSTGMRVGELLKSYVHDIDFDDCLFNLPAQNTKNRKPRSCRIHPEVLNELKGYLKINGIKKGVLFPSYNHKKSISVRRVQMIVKKFGVKCGLDWVHPHTFRHTHIVHALMQGLPISAVQKNVGHLDLRTTQIYSDLSVADVKKAYDGVDF